MSATDNAAAGAALPPGMSRYPGMLKAAAILAMLIQVLDMTIANVALPHMQAALGANQDDSISWVLTSYIVAAAIAIPATGWLSRPSWPSQIISDLCRRFYVIISSMRGLALNLETMVLFRILQVCLVRSSHRLVRQ